MEVNTPIAKLSLFGKRPGEEPFEITIEIGLPYRHQREDLPNDIEDWACPVSLSPLFKRLADARGGDSFQALCLAISLVQGLLHDFREKGGALSHDGMSNDFPLQAYSFSDQYKVNKPVD